MPTTVHLYFRWFKPVWKTLSLKQQVIVLLSRTFIRFHKFFTSCLVIGAERYLVSYELELSDLHNTTNMIETTESAALVENLSQGSHYWFAVKAINFQGLISEGSDPVFVTTCEFSMIKWSNKSSKLVKDVVLYWLKVKRKKICATIHRINRNFIPYFLVKITF